MTEDFIKGLVTRIESKDYYVSDSAEKEFRCNLPGRYKKEFALKKDKLYIVDVVAVGDFVDFEINEDGTGTIQTIHERRNHLSRKAPKIKGASFRGERLEQIIASNVDNLVIVSSAENPRFNSRVIDRLIVIAESSHVVPIILINKIDLEKNHKLEEWHNLYADLGYKIFLISAKENIGLEGIPDILDGKISLFWGQSGVGKSTVLNVIYPHLNLRVGEISESTSKGTHTTVTVLMQKIGGSTYIIDTPGIREIDPYGIKKEDLGHYFPDISSIQNNCRFNTCTHLHEPGCAVIDAVETGEIDPRRYQSYLNILETIEDDMRF
ncbi:MAG: ribosome small subunit-dependent GTPase A [Bacteroidetes bacterium]|nr:ribosome small subunit-dependent GTPase A [Bacteroidota bacterium]